MPHSPLIVALLVHQKNQKKHHKKSKKQKVNNNKEEPEMEELIESLLTRQSTKQMAENKTKPPARNAVELEGQPSTDAQRNIEDTQDEQNNSNQEFPTPTEEELVTKDEEVEFHNVESDVDETNTLSSIEEADESSLQDSDSDTDDSSSHSDSTDTESDDEDDLLEPYKSHFGG